MTSEIQCLFRHSNAFHTSIYSDLLFLGGLQDLEKLGKLCGDDGGECQLYNSVRGGHLVWDILHLHPSMVRPFQFLLNGYSRHHIFISVANPRPKLSSSYGCYTMTIYDSYPSPQSSLFHISCASSWGADASRAIYRQLEASATSAAGIPLTTSLASTPNPTSTSNNTTSTSTPLPPPTATNDPEPPSSKVWIAGPAVGLVAALLLLLALILWWRMRKKAKESEGEEEGPEPEPESEPDYSEMAPAAPAGTAGPAAGPGPGPRGNPPGYIDMHCGNSYTPQLRRPLLTAPPTAPFMGSYPSAAAHGHGPPPPFAARAHSLHNTKDVSNTCSQRSFTVPGQAVAQITQPPWQALARPRSATAPVLPTLANMGMGTAAEQEAGPKQYQPYRPPGGEPQ